MHINMQILPSRVADSAWWKKVMGPGVPAAAQLCLGMGEWSPVV